MTPYKNVSGDSGVSAYEIGSDFIRVRFSTGQTYLWTNASAGRVHIERMKQLAFAGKGLNTYINKWARKTYSRRER